MDATNFAYWLNGFAELTGDTAPTPEQWAAIKQHLALVFEKVTPPVGLPSYPRWDQTAPAPAFPPTAAAPPVLSQWVTYTVEGQPTLTC